MNHRRSLLPGLVITYALLIGAAIMNTSLAEESAPTPNKFRAHATKARDWKKAKVIGLSTDVRNPRRTSAPAKTAGMERNAIGQHIRTPQANLGPDRRLFTPTAADLATKSVTIAPRIGSASVSEPDFHRPISVPIRSIRTGTNDPAVNTPMNHSSINGTGMKRPGSGTSMIGSAPKGVVGAINGTNFRPKHP